MSFPPKLRAKYLDHFDALIADGDIVQATSYPHPKIRDGRTGDPKQLVSAAAYGAWRMRCVNLLHLVLPKNHPQQKLIERWSKSRRGLTSIGDARFVQQTMKAIRSDFASGLLGDISEQIEAEIAADYMSQAEQLLAEGQTGKYDHVPGAVLAGAVLEKALRALCGQQQPTVPTRDTKGKPVMLNGLIDALKKASAFNEMKAKQLRAWAAIRNHAAHGEFNEFTRTDAEQMIQGINSFLADHMD